MRIGDCSSDVCSSDLFQSTIGQPKVDVVSRMARDINPDLDINKFPDGVTLDNMEQFLSGVDLYVDGLDFFVLDIRARLFALCAERGIPAITAAPLGMGAAVLAFLPGHMRSEEHTSELQSLMRISYAVFCLKKKKTSKNTTCERQPQLKTTLQ